ncbi:recombinase family protein [Curtobacterium sp. MCPF17_018]|uniref:recombinase family protein n=1 Tax=Curtobacterium sp. MCPF17_018 TaxID=2175638 RepID=UPI000DA7C7BF|nr:recombinase family protein [Curtobacterium sp. MCPF17_018]PZE69282.1 recombinase family protein [Curtobacterium sp. MCPF17_018]
MRLAPAPRRSRTTAPSEASEGQVSRTGTDGKHGGHRLHTECLQYLRTGDVLLVYSTDRLGRSMTDVVTIVTELSERGVEFRSLTEPFDTTTAGGELFFHICAAFAQMNGRIISDRTRAGLAAAAARGRRGGRPTVMTPDPIAVARQMRTEDATWDTIATTLQGGASSIRRALDKTPTPPATQRG